MINGLELQKPDFLKKMLQLTDEELAEMNNDLLELSKTLRLVFKKNKCNSIFHTTNLYINNRYFRLECSSVFSNGKIEMEIKLLNEITADEFLDYESKDKKSEGWIRIKRDK